jgi:hypothetical protein
MAGQTEKSARDGRLGLAKVIRIKDSWEADRIEPEQLDDTGSKVIMHNRWTTKGKDSVIGFETWFWVVCRAGAPRERA